MKYKTIMENWKRYLTEITEEEASWFGPVISKLSENPDLAYDLEWIKENVGYPMGRGASRIVFGMHFTSAAMSSYSDLVLKVARENAKQEGGFTNHQEKIWFNRYPEFFPRVWLTAEPQQDAKAHWNRAKGGYVDTEFTNTPWIIVDRVKVIKNFDEYRKIILKAFPIFKKATDYIDSIVTSDKGHTLMKVEELFRLFIHTAVIDGPKPDWDMGPTRREKKLTRLKDALKFLLRARKYGMNIDTSQAQKPSISPESFADAVWNMLNEDYRLKRFRSLVADVGIDILDIGTGNVGTDIETESKFLIIDISKFLDEESVLK